MRAKGNRKLRKVGGRYMLVDVSEKDANITNVYTLNATAAFVWTLLCSRNVNEEEIAIELCKTYDVSHDTALADVKRLIASWLGSGLVSI